MSIGLALLGWGVYWAIRFEELVYERLRCFLMDMYIAWFVFIPYVYVCIHSPLHTQSNPTATQSKSPSPPPPPPSSYSHTFENKSSFPPNPLLAAAGVLLCCAVEPVVFDVGAALLQPPKSSSCATCGAPQPGLLGATCEEEVVVVVFAAGWLGAEEPHTSLPPHASMLENPPLKLGAAAGAGAGAGAGVERLKAELIGGEDTGAGAALGAGAGAEGMERSRRSPIPDEEGAGLVGAGEEKDEKSLIPLEGLIVRLCAWPYAGGDFGFESKKLPPPPNMFDEDVVGGDFALEKLSSPEKGEGLGCAGAAWLKLRPLKASFIPPKLDCWGDAWLWGDAMPPKDSCRACCCGCAAGFAAYSDRIDCLRSGLDGADAAAGPVLDGRAGCAFDPPPKKSSPSSESPALFCFGGAACGGPARAATGGPVLGR